MKTWNVYWAPEGRVIATVDAETARAAIHKAPMPYHKYLGEMYAVETPAPTVSVPTTCIEHAYGTAERLSFQIKVF